MRQFPAPPLTHGASDRASGRALDDTDDALMLRVGAGDRDAFRGLLERHLGRIVAFATRALGNRAGAEDIAQETFLRLWTTAARWQPQARLGTWLHRVALNLCLDRLERKHEVALDDIAEPTDPHPSPAARMQTHDIATHVNAAIAELPTQQRIAITLCHYQELRNIEAAEMMGVSIEALESLLARGRRTLRARLRAALPDLLGED